MSEATTFETEQYPWWLILLGGILSIFVGLLLLTNPLKTVTVLVWALGLYWIIQGIFMLIGMFLDHSAWGWKLFMGILSILAGIVVLRHPIASTAVVPMILVLNFANLGTVAVFIWVVAIFSIAGGLVQIFQAFRQRTA